VGDILSDAQELVGQQLELFKAEVQADFQRTLRATGLLGAGLGFLLASVPLLGVMLAYWLNSLGLSLPASFGLATLVIAALGGGLVLYAVQLFRSFNPLPDETAESVQENVAWLKRNA
jgi:uncharacterized membrane-anchored protein